MIIDNVYVFTPDKAFVKGGIILDGDKIRQVYEEKDAPQLNGADVTVRTVLTVKRGIFAMAMSSRMIQ